MHQTAASQSSLNAHSLEVVPIISYGGNTVELAITGAAYAG